MVGAVAVSDALWSRFSTQPARRWERWASIAILAFVIGIALSWLLSWIHLLDRVPLLIGALAIGLSGALVLYRRGAFRGAAKPIQISAWSVIPLLPLLVWIVFVLWRGSILPVLSHDALAYHMPKAVMMARAHHYDFFPAPDPRITTSPADYELLLADVILLTGSDDLTEWVGTASYLALLLLAAALAQRWWGDGPHVLLTILLTASIPVILLHSGAHKNDLMANAFYLAALLWGGRWLASRETAPLLLMLLSLAAGAGTKLQTAFVIAGIALVALLQLMRRRLRLPILVIVIVFIASMLLLGGWPYVANMRHTGHAAIAASAQSEVGYGDWTNLVEVPLIVLMRPFDPSVADVFIPWRGERWYWPRFELYFSDFGFVITLLVLAIPFVAKRYARNREERLLTSLSAIGAFILMLPIKIRPLGFFAGFPRYFAFIAIFVIAWTAAPLARELWLRRRKTALGAVIAVAMSIFVATAVIFTNNDTFQPLEYVAKVAENPGWRQPFFATYRAASVLDLIAEPTDTIAVHGGFDTWIHPLYGPTLQRKVIFIDADQPIPAEAKFVVVDRTWNIIWGDPRFKNMGQWKQYLAKGKPSEEDVAVVKWLFANQKTYGLLYYNRLRNQAVFVRRDALPLRPRSAAPTAASSH
jgi:4-amino-4-deoxy-L-arabinose transferase-like glycosyltransferase